MKMHAALARRSFARLLERPESEFLGLRGLLGEALRTGDDAAARSFATRAHQLRPAAPWLTDSRHATCGAMAGVTCRAMPPCGGRLIG